MAEIDLLKIEEGDVVQIDPESDGKFAACLMIVTEVKNWGLKGYVTVPGAIVGGSGQAFYRVSHDNYVKVGPAKWLRSEDGE